MEQQAKERLTGGVILVVLLVLLVPELLTGPRAVPPPAPAQPDEAPMRSYTMDLRESAHANARPVAPSTAVAPPGETASIAAGSAPAPAASQPAAPAPKTPATAAPAAPRTRAPASPTPAAHTAVVWTVQLGTFSSRENASRLIARLKSHGFNGSISEASKSGHKLFRVRVGSERDKAGAQRLLGRLKGAGEKGGQIVPR